MICVEGYVDLDEMTEVLQKNHQLCPIRIHGNHREVGCKLGELAREVLPLFFKQSSTWKRLQQWKDTPLFERLKSNVMMSFPDIWEELQGLSEGARVNINDILLWNFRGDLVDKCNDGCTTVIYRHSSQGVYICHNEDGDPYLYNKCFLVDVSFADTKSPSFFSFYYPGSVPGHAFAVNEYGLVQTINSLRVKGTVIMDALNAATLPRMVLSRAVMNCSSVEDAVALLSSYSSLGAFHYNLCSPAACSSSAVDLRSVEHSPWGCSERVITESTPTVHANHMLYPQPSSMSLLADGANILSQSSIYRQCAATSMSQDVATASDVKACLLSIVSSPKFDSTFLSTSSKCDPDEKLSILRCRTDDQDEEYTLATALFRVLLPTSVPFDASSMSQTTTLPPALRYKNDFVELDVYDICQQYR